MTVDAQAKRKDPAGTAPDEARRRTVMASLLARETGAPAGPCPEAAVLAALTDGRLSGEDRERVLAHVERCPACYREWLAAAAALDKGKPLLSRNWAWFATGGVVCVGILFFFLTGAFDPASRAHRLVNAGYTTAEKLLKAQLAQPLEPANTATTRGGATTQRQRAYAAGCFAGAQALSGKPPALLPEALRPEGAGKPAMVEDWDRTALFRYVELGRWVSLTKRLCALPAPAPEAVWAAQAEGLQAVAALFAAARGPEDDRLRKMLGEIEGILHRSDMERGCLDIGDVLERLDLFMMKES